MCLNGQSKCTQVCEYYYGMEGSSWPHTSTHTCTLYDMAAPWTLSIIGGLSPAPLHPSISASSHLLPIESLCVQIYSAGGMFNLFPAVQHKKTQTRALLQVGLQLKYPLHFFPHSFLFLFLLSLISFLCLLFEVSLGPCSASSTLCLG